MVNNKKIGREVAFLKTGHKNPRNGEGTFARLKDGKIMHVYTEYYGDSFNDNATARLSAIFSADEGESWSKPTVLLEKDGEAENYMSPSLLRLPDGDLGLLFLRKQKKETGIDCDGEKFVCMPVFCRSSDEGKSWSEYTFCIDRDGYY